MGIKNIDDKSPTVAQHKYAGNFKCSISYMNTAQQLGTVNPAISNQPFWPIKEQKIQKKKKKKNDARTSIYQDCEYPQ